MCFKEFQQDVRRDVVRKISYNARPYWFTRTQISERPGTLPNHGGYIGFEDVGLDNLNVRHSGIAHTQLGREYAVEFHGDEPPGTHCDEVCKGSFTGADLHDRGLRNVSERVHDFLHGLAVHQEILSQFGFLLRHTASIR